MAAPAILAARAAAPADARAGTSGPGPPGNATKRCDFYWVRPARSAPLDPGAPKAPRRAAARTRHSAARSSARDRLGHADRAAWDPLRRRGLADVRAGLGAAPGLVVATVHSMHTAGTVVGSNARGARGGAGDTGAAAFGALGGAGARGSDYLII